MSRTVDWVITKAYLAAQRKASPPATGTNKYNALLGLADTMQLMWQDEPDTDWSSLWSLVTLADTVSATDTFALSTTINNISSREGDYVLLTDGTNTVPVKVITPNQLYEYRYVLACAQVGSNLKFSKAFVATDTTIGYSIKVPSYLNVSDITTGTDVVQVDSPMWLAYMMAADFIKGDTVKSVLYDKLLALADQHMQKMKSNNGGQQEAIVANWVPEGANWS